MIQWSEDYRLGINNIDEQHKQLFELANESYKILKDEILFDKYDQIVAIINELKEYTTKHFSEEEEFLASIGYPKLLSHKVQHADFIKKIEDIDLNKIDENQEQALIDLLDFFSDWLLNHILKTDSEYIKYI
ncbi:MAG: iron-binding protein, hemerythrin [Firmicutes bacterium]|nr:iron-binding protein, hemerythrin [Bacillota bacterium]